MELELIRTYFPNGTNGEILSEGKRVCSSIELPWLYNQHKVSCIPEGRYELKKRYTRKRGWHLIVMDVPDRSGILIHVANDAMKELEGCIAPVSLLTAGGRGTRSREALNKVTDLVDEAFDRGEEIFLIIKLEENEKDHSTGESTYTKVF